MILHLVNDEKIINRTIDEFESVYPGDNLWVVANRPEDFRLVEPHANVMGRKEFLRHHAREHYDHIFIHLLNPRKISILKKMDLSGSRIHWIIWGLDLYNKLLVPKGFRLYAGGNSMLRHGTPAGRLIKRLTLKAEARKTIGFIERHVDSIITDTTEIDYDYLTRYYPQLKDKRWQDFFYYPIDVILNAELMESEVNGNDIMIGNSASGTNNHEHVMDLLAQLDTGSRRIVVPLSYSGKGKYVGRICEKGKELFGDHFVPLLKFLPLAEYNLQQRSTSVTIFGNLRQEAIGNVIIALYLGAKVFLEESNPVYTWACDHGLKAYTLNELTQEEIDTPTPPAVLAETRGILRSLYSRRRMHELIRNLTK